jgi:hypothetical protein
LFAKTPNLALHPRRVTGIADAGEIGGGNGPEGTYFDQGLEFRSAKEIGTVAKVIGARRVERLWYPLFPESAFFARWIDRVLQGLYGRYVSSRRRWI